MTDLHDLLSKYPKEERMKKFWVCWVEGTNGGRHVMHYNLLEAQKETERLALLEVKPVYILECIGKCQVPVMWKVPR